MVCRYLGQVNSYTGGTMSISGLAVCRTQGSRQSPKQRASAARKHRPSRRKSHLEGQSGGSIARVSVTQREIDGFHAYGTLTKLTTVDGRIPDAQRWLPGVVSSRLNIRVRSTTARML